MFFQNKKILQENRVQKEGTVGSKKGRWLVLFALFALLLIQVGVLVYYGGRKTGFHEDEFYSYYSTNRTAGLYINDRTWVERDEFRNEFVVLPGEEFRYGLVKEVQSWDVHPPFYYYLLHTVCSLSTGIFSKWQGILVNLIGFVPCFFLLFYLVYCCMKPSQKEKTDAGAADTRRALYFGFATCLFWGLSAAVISGVMFIRMYQWLTLFVLLCGVLHVKALKEEKFGKSFLLPLAFTVFFGVLTQYYYFIFHFFMGVGFCFLMLKRKQIKTILLYAMSCAVGMGAAILYYPSSLAHVFRGYRGTEAVSEFSNASNTLDRLQFFAGLFDEYVMNGTLCVFLLGICLLWLTVHATKKQMVRRGQTLSNQEDGKKAELTGLLLFASLGYFFTISKTALLLGESSNRYQLPVYGILLFLVVYYLCTPVLRLAQFYIKKQKGTEESKINWQKIMGVAFLVLLLFIDVTALRSGKVFFLYEEEKQMQEFVKDNCEMPVVVFYNDATPYNVWRISDQLMEFPSIYLASQGNGDVLEDETIVESAKLLVYVADYENKENCLENLLKSNSRLSGYREVAKKGLWTLYEME